MKQHLQLPLLFAFLLLVFYVLIPNPSFPKPTPDAVMSKEEGDTESPLKHAYFTNFTREQVMAHYMREMGRSSFLGIPLLTYQLTYPPEEAQTLVRDQTRSTFLEEVVHPLRESAFINGFEPKAAKDEIWYRGSQFRQKITVRFVPSNPLVRLVVVILSSLVSWLIVKEWRKTLRWIFQ